MFNHVELDFEIEKLKTVNIEGKRLYEPPDGLKYPSITTVLGWFSAKGIMAWRKRVGEKEANKISSQAARRGTSVHKMCEDYINNVELNFSKMIPTDLELFKIMQPVLDNAIDNVYSQECSLYSDHLRLAGTVDCVAEYMGKLSIIDFKTSRQTMVGDKYGKLEKYFRQASGYSVMFEERTGIPINNLVIIAAVDGKSEPEVFTSKRDSHIDGLRGMIEEYNENHRTLLELHNPDSYLRGRTTTVRANM